MELFVQEMMREDLTVPCPICGETTLHHYYCRGKPVTTRVLNGITFDHDGGLWEWCSSCYTYAHYSALVPADWKSSLTVDSNKLIPIPDAIEDARLLKIENT